MKDYKLLLKNASLIDGKGNATIMNANIVIQEEKINAIFFGVNKIDEQQFSEVIDLTGCSVLPGFINAHVHSGFKEVKGKPLIEFQKDYLRACVKEGVTSIRDEGMFLDCSIDEVIHKKKLLEAKNSYPSIIVTGKFFSAPGGYGGVNPIQVSTKEEVVRNVEEVVKKGVDVIKTVLEDGLDPSTRDLPKLSFDLLKLICIQAHKRGIKVSAHVTQSHNLKILIEAGIDDAAHIIYDELTDELIESLVQNDVSIVPTLTVHKMISDKYNIPLIETAKKNVFKFVHAGGKIGFGDDFIEEELPWYRFGMPWKEIELLKESGLTNVQIIVAATKNNAEICGRDKEIGTVEVGKNADLLIVYGCPITDIQALKNTRMVIKNGEIVN